MIPIFNWSRRKVGGIWFVKLGRFNLSFCISRRSCRVYEGGNTVVVYQDQ
jgi:hypothetical protein